MISYEETKIILEKMKDCICVINDGNDCKETGFFCSIPYKNKTLKVMITCNHCIDEEFLENNSEIKIELNYEYKAIKLYDKKKYIQEGNTI